VTRQAAAPHLGKLGAQARPAGGAAVIAAQGYCRRALDDLGFVIKEHSFEYSKFGGRWARPIGGLAFPACGTMLALTANPQLRLIAGFTLFALALFLFMAGSGGVLSFPVMRARGRNIEAVRGGGEPRIWLVAHIDSKWQPVSMLARVAGVVGASTSILVLALAIFLWPDTAPFWLGVLWLSSLPLILSVVGTRNHGTLDNASGVATVLNAVERLPRDLPIGVLITDAEELALAGARAWAITRKPRIAINCDSIDDDGPLVVMYSRQSPTELVSKLQAAASAEEEPIRVMKLIPGILTDHVALADAGWTTLTLSRGTVRTLGRIHSSRDTLDHMDGRGIVGAAKVLARTVTELS
jgi:hypothetical protein